MNSYLRRTVASIHHLNHLIQKNAHQGAFVSLLLLGFAVAGCTSVTPRFQNGGAFCPSGALTNGSREFHGAVDFNITVDLSPSNMGRSINAHVTMVAEGPGGNITREWDRVVHTLPRETEGIITAINPSSGRAFGTTPGAGAEFIGPCNDGHVSTGPGELRVSGVIERIEVIGDTGAQDISDDSNCHCDTQIRSLRLTSVELTREGRAVPADRTDTTPPRLSFKIHPTSVDLDSPTTAEIITFSQSLRARSCVYVNSPFRVSASASDEGGIRGILILPKLGAPIRARDEEGDITALVTPIVETQTTGGSAPYRNPGKLPGLQLISVDYEDGGPVFSRGALSGVYVFLPGASEGVPFVAEARNFGERGGLSSIWDYWVKPAPPGISAGTECNLGPD